LRKQVIGPNPTDAKQLSAGERLAEIAQTLAAGLMRLARKSSPKSADFGESSLAFSGLQRGDAEAVGLAAP
jgi:hypothetical protein